MTGRNLRTTEGLALVHSSPEAHRRGGGSSVDRRGIDAGRRRYDGLRALGHNAAGSGYDRRGVVPASADIVTAT